MDIIKVKVTIENPKTGEEKVVIDDKYRSLAYLAEDYENDAKVAEVVVHTSISGMAMNISGSEKFRAASKLASLIDVVKDNLKGHAEDSLISQIEESMGGLQ